MELTAQEAKNLGFEWQPCFINGNPKGLKISKLYKGGSVSIPAANCESEVVIPDKIDGIDVVAIGKNAFVDGKMKSIILHDNILIIECNAFKSCKKMESVNIPKNIISIGKYAFQNCSKIKTLNILSNNDVSIEHGAFALCYSLRDVNLSKKIKCIPRSCFFRAKSLEKIVIPDYTEEIEPFAFQECSSLKYIRLSLYLKTIGTDVFDKVHPDCKILYNEFQMELQEEIRNRYPLINIKMEPYRVGCFL